jgi:hypothetical protein
MADLHVLLQYSYILVRLCTEQAMFSAHHRFAVYLCCAAARPSQLSFASLALERKQMSAIVLPDSAPCLHCLHTSWYYRREAEFVVPTCVGEACSTCLAGSFRNFQDC